jgi:hypothetical protein
MCHVCCICDENCHVVYAIMSPFLSSKKNITNCSVEVVLFTYNTLNVKNLYSIICILFDFENRYKKVLKIVMYKLAVLLL